MLKRIVILGAGFAGLPAARDLAKTLASEAEVVLIDRRREFQFSPRLIDSLATDDAVPCLTADLEAIAKRDGFRFLQGNVLGLSREQQTVTVQENGTPHQLRYDVLIIATGSQANDYGIPGVKEFAMPLKTVDDAKRIRERISAKPHAVTVVGAGAAGIEAVFALQRYTKGKGILSVVEASPQILRGFNDTIVNGCKNELKKRGIRLCLNDRVVRVTRDALELASGERIPSDCTIWTAGICAVVPPQEPPLLLEHGCLVTDASLRAAPHVLAAGDCIQFRDTNVIIPKNAQTALRMGEVLAVNARRMLCDQRLEPFRYISLGNILSLQQTGFLDFRLFTLKTRFANRFRDLFYRWRFRQVTGNAH